jgi:hypothetical protein
MPRLARFDGIEIVMNTRDHLPPHVHVLFKEEEVVIEIADGAVYAGSIAGHALTAARGWIAANREDLMARWAEYQRR